MAVRLFLTFATTLLTMSLPDLHPGNGLFTCDEHTKKPRAEILRTVGIPRTADVHAVHYNSSIPKYMVESRTPLIPPSSSDVSTFKLIDFGSSFFSGRTAPKMRCPLPFRAPEAVLTHEWDTPADVWSLGCTVCTA